MQTEIKIIQKQFETINVTHDLSGNVEIFQWNITKEEGSDIIWITQQVSREVALAICPELESELKEATELIEIYTQQNQVAREGFVSVINNEIYSRAINFLTKHKNK